MILLCMIFQRLYLPIAEKIVRPYYSGNMSNAFNDLIQKAIREENFVLSHVKQERNRGSPIENAKKGP